MKVAEYGPSRRGDVADLTERVWGERPGEDELEWLFERNPVRPASVLLGEEDGRVVGCAAIGFARMAIEGEEVEVGVPMRLATDPDHRGRGVFATLQLANEERARGLGIRLLLIVPNAASARILTGRLGWRPLPPLRVWARPRLLPARRGPRVEGFPEGAGTRGVGGADRVLRDAAWLEWRFARAPRRYTLLEERGGYAAIGVHGRVSFLAAVEDLPLRAVAAAAPRPLLAALPPPWLRREYAAAGFVPTTRTFRLLGKSLDGRRLPDKPHFELGDLDFV